MNELLRNIALFLSFAIGIYNILIWIRIIFTWFRAPGLNFESPMVHTLAKIVDPYLNLFKGFSFMKTKNIDFTPLLAFAFLSIAKSLLELFGTSGTLPLGISLALIVKTLYSYLISPFFLILIILLIIRLVLCYKRNPHTVAISRAIESIIGSLLNWVQKNIYGSKLIANRTLIITTLILTLVIFFAARFGIIKLVIFLADL